MTIEEFPQPAEEYPQHRPQVNRQRRLLLTAGLVVAGAAAVGVPAYLLLRGTGRDGFDPLLQGREPRPKGGGAWAAMSVRPTWLPEGLVEISRAARIGEVWQTRHFVSPEFFTADLGAIWDGAKPTFKSVGLRVEAVDPNAGVEAPPTDQPVPPTDEPVPAGGQSASPAGPTNPFGEGPEPNVMIGQYPGHINGGAIVVVKFRIDQMIVSLEVSGPGTDEDMALRIARSVVVDDSVGLELSLNFGWLPTALAAESVKLSASYEDKDNWSDVLEVYKLDGLSVEAGRGRSTRKPWHPAAEDRPRTIRGLPGYVGDRTAAVPLPDGTVLTSRIGYVADGRDMAIRVLEELVLADNPYRGWTGGR